MKEKYYKENIRTGNDRINHFRRETTDGEVLHRWLLAGVRKLMPALFLQGYRNLIKTGGKLPFGSYCPMAIKGTRTLALRLKPHFEIVLSPPETLFFTPYRSTIKSTNQRWWQRFVSSGGSVEKRCGNKIRR